MYVVRYGLLATSCVLRIAFAELSADVFTNIDNFQVWDIVSVGDDRVAVVGDYYENGNIGTATYTFNNNGVIADSLYLDYRYEIHRLIAKPLSYYLFGLEHVIELNENLEVQNIFEYGDLIEDNGWFVSRWLCTRPDEGFSIVYRDVNQENSTFLHEFDSALMLENTIDINYAADGAYNTGIDFISFRDPDKYEVDFHLDLSDGSKQTHRLTYENSVAVDIAHYPSEAHYNTYTETAFGRLCEYHDEVYFGYHTSHLSLLDDELGVVFDYRLPNRDQIRDALVFGGTKVVSAGSHGRDLYNIPFLYLHDYDGQVQDSILIPTSYSNHSSNSVKIALLSESNIAFAVNHYSYSGSKITTIVWSSIPPVEINIQQSQMTFLTEPGYCVSDTLFISNLGVSSSRIDSLSTSEGLFSSSFDSPTTLNPGDSLGVEISFCPNTQGLYTDTLHIWANTDISNTEDPRHHVVPLIGEAGPIPAAVTDLSISILEDLSAHLTWSPVDTTIYGNPVTPDWYLVFYNERDPLNDDDWYYHGAVAAPGYTHFMVAQYSDLMNYRVVAWKGIDLSSLGLIEGMSKVAFDTLATMRIR